jgi:multidrug efflux pump subunit AcrA (membrane-fusion protein)
MGEHTRLNLDDRPRDVSPASDLESASGGNRPWSTLRWFSLVMALLTAAAIIVFVITKKKTAAESEEEANVTVSVKVAKAERGPIAATVRALGTIFPKEQATVSAKIASQIKTMSILKNKQVKAGEVLAVLETRDLQAQKAEAEGALQEARHMLEGMSLGAIPQTNAQDEKAIRDAQATLKNAKATYDRRRVLFDQGGISKKDVEASELALTTAENDLRLAETAARLHKTAISPNDRAQAEAKVRQAQDHLANLNAQLSYADIRAPISGTVTDQFQFQGEYAAAGSKLFTVMDLSEVIVKAPFADVVASTLKTGDPATVKPTDQPGVELEGKISLVSRAGDPTSRTFEIWVRLPNKDGRLKGAGSAEVTVTTKEIEDAVTVPVSAVSLDATNASNGLVMIVDENSVAHEVKVTVGIHTRDRYQITSGLNGGETVVTEGNYALPDGTKVEVSTGEEEKPAGGEEEKPGESGKEKDPGDKD